MSLSNRRAILATLSVFLLLLGLSACDVPIAPGYRIAKEAREIHFIPGASPGVAIQLTYTLVNSGTSDLSFIDVTLPLAPLYGRTDLHAELDGHATELGPLPAEEQFDSPNQLRINLNSPWKTGQSHDLAIAYTFQSPAEIGSSITLSAEAFHLGSRGAFAVLEPPKHILAPFPKRPKAMFYTVSVPANFRVLARGTPAGRKESQGEIAFRYRLAGDELAAYVVAGRYVESAPHGETGTVFWTFQPVAIDAAGAHAISDAWNTLRKAYGPLDKTNRGPHIVEVADLPVHITGAQGPAAVAFPGGALVNAAALAQGTQSEAFLEEISHALAHNWFGDQIYPAPDDTLGLGEGLPEYATIVIDEARGGEAARRRSIARFLADYDAAVRQGTEETLAVSRITDPPATRRIALAKAPLFYAALEDECGAPAMRKGLAEIVALMRGQEVSYNVLRAALERASGKNLAPTFRLWLNEKGIPADFRARYGNAAAGQE